MITFIITHKERENSSVAMLISFMGKKYKIAIGETVPVAAWSQKSKRVKVKAGRQDLASINDSLDKWQEAGERALAKYREKYIIPMPQELYSAITNLRHGRDVSEETRLVPYFDTFIDRYTHVRSFNRIRQYKLVKHVVERYERDSKRTLRFDDIDMGFHSAFSKWFAVKGYSPNYLGDCLKIIRTVMRDAEELDKLHSNRAPYSKMFTIPSARVDNIYLTEDELIRLYRLDITTDLIMKNYEGITRHKAEMKRDALCQARDMFIVAAFTGLRFSDCHNLSNDSIKDGFFEIYNKKTDVKTVIPIHWVIQEMLDNGYNFNAKMYEQKLNIHIKEVAKLAGLVELVSLTRFEGMNRVSTAKPKYEWISTHTARRSFATNAYLSGIPVVSIMKITGHTRESTFMDYIKVKERENAELVKNSDFFSKKR